VQTDPDVAYFASRGNSLPPEHKQMLQDLALVCNFRATSDLPQWLSAEEKDSLRAFLKDKHKPAQTGRYTFKLGKKNVDFSSAVSMPQPASGFDSLQSAVMGWLGSQGWVLRILDRIGKSSLAKMKKVL
jgi:hypothetical protein